MTVSSFFILEKNKTVFWGGGGLRRVSEHLGGMSLVEGCQAEVFMALTLAWHLYNRVQIVRFRSLQYLTSTFTENNLFQKLNTIPSIVFFNFF